MKNLLCLLLVLPLIFGCDDENDNNGSQNSDYWMFEVTINGGLTHKAEGYGPPLTTDYNFASTCFSDGHIFLHLGDPSASTYVSGEQGGALLWFEDPVSTGLMNLRCQLGFNFVPPSGASFAYGCALTSGGTPESTDFQIGLTLPFTITDIGTAGIGDYTEGTPFKGSFSGTVYLPNEPQLGVPTIYNIPLSIEVQFVALRC